MTLMVFSEVELPLKLIYGRSVNPPKGMVRSAMVRVADRPGIWQVMRRDEDLLGVEFTLERVDVVLHPVGA